MIAITFALPAESSDLVRSIDRSEVAIVHTGVGQKFAAAKIDNFLRANKPDILISSGFAGALHDGFQVGDLILAENYSDRQLFHRAGELLFAHNVQPAKLFTSNAIADSADERLKIHQTYGADAIDMESEAIAAACATHAVPMLSLRVITDSPRDPLPAPPDVLFNIERQKTSFVRLLCYCVAQPKTIPQLVRFSRNIAMARAELTSALLTLLREQRLLCASLKPNEAQSA